MGLLLGMYSVEGRVGGVQVVVVVPVVVVLAKPYKLSILGKCHHML
jgi:hypothetical protein